MTNKNLIKPDGKPNVIKPDGKPKVLRPSGKPNMFNGNNFVKKIYE